MTIILSNPNRFTFFFTGRFVGKFAVKRILEIPPHLACVATLPLKQAMNDKLQGSVATYSSCGGVVNNQKFERFIAECVSEKNFNIGEYLAKLQARACLSHALCVPGQHTAKRRRKFTRQSRFCL